MAKPGSVVSPKPQGVRARDPLETVTARRQEGEFSQAVSESVAAEVPVAMQYNARPYAVMMATPTDLADFAYGFALTERIIASVSELTLVDQLWTEHGVALEMLIPRQRFLMLSARERNLTGRTGCGLCGTATLEAAIRPVRHVDPQAPAADLQTLREGMRRLATLQPLNDASGAVHAAALLSGQDGFTVREDVGRHNAIDKAVGALMRAGLQPHTLLVTSRASYEVVHKAAEVGCRLVAAISAPTSLALQLAREAGITLVGWTRPPRLTIYCGSLS
ncbi:MAG TPA: formate dehydrogenase accessory sulfurtransferase FdhD [Steroidobacteraceae bacterium]|nr:formate dehydrogenase accessory sulfurtransferase FdhD [Steroidobacteraceae bacterium]